MVSCEQAPQTTDLPLVGLRVNDVLGADDSAGFRKADQVIAFRFPRDHGAHPSFRSEWWYLTAAVEDRDGNAYGFQFTLFRQALTASRAGDSAWQSGQAYLAHFAVTDVGDKQHFADQRFARQHPDNAGVTLSPRFAARLADWALTEQAGGTEEADGATKAWPLKLVARGEDETSAVEFAVDVQLHSAGPPRLQGDRGLSHKGPGEASYYYSMPRIAVTGTLEIEGRPRTITGLAWLDREWSTSVLAEGVVGWDWLALHLTDGRDLMAFRLRRKDGRRDPYDHGLLVAENAASVLQPADFELTPTRYWHDERGAGWPVAWVLTLATGEDLYIEALVDDQLMRLGLVYWEGLVQVTDALGSLRGHGYLELTGYAYEESETKEP